MTKVKKNTGAKKESPLYVHDKKIKLEFQNYIVGIDEAGRGPLAGPVVAAAVCLDLSKPILNVNDSKKLTSQKRDELYEQITQEAISWGVALCTPQEIDKINILQATLVSMQKALDQISCLWDLVLIDGNKEIPTLEKTKQKTIVKGDAASASIAAASIVAKVTRDRIMDKLHDEYPLYDFISNKGYGTESHRRAIEQHGMSKVHRRSFCEVIACQTRLEL